MLDEYLSKLRFVELSNHDNLKFRESRQSQQPQLIFNFRNILLKAFIQNLFSYYVVAIALFVFFLFAKIRN